MYGSRTSCLFTILILIAPNDKLTLIDTILPCTLQNFFRLTCIIFGLLIVIALVIYGHSSIIYILLKLFQSKRCGQRINYHDTSIIDIRNSLLDNKPERLSFLIILGQCKNSYKTPTHIFGFQSVHRLDKISICYNRQSSRIRIADKAKAQRRNERQGRCKRSALINKFCDCTRFADFLFVFVNLRAIASQYSSRIHLLAISNGGKNQGPLIYKTFGNTLAFIFQFIPIAFKCIA